MYQALREVVLPKMVSYLAVKYLLGEWDSFTAQLIHWGLASFSPPPCPQTIHLAPASAPSLPTCFLPSTAPIEPKSLS